MADKRDAFLQTWQVIRFGTSLVIFQIVIKKTITNLFGELP